MNKHYQMEDNLHSKLMQWIAQRAGPYLDAEPGIFADYVIRMLSNRRGNPGQEKEDFDEKLVDFLKEETHSFVDDLFKFLENEKLKKHSHKTYRSKKEKKKKKHSKNKTKSVNTSTSETSIDTPVPLYLPAASEGGLSSFGQPARLSGRLVFPGDQLYAEILGKELESNRRFVNTATSMNTLDLSRNLASNGNLSSCGLPARFFDRLVFPAAQSPNDDCTPLPTEMPMEFTTFKIKVASIPIPEEDLLTP